MLKKFTSMMTAAILLATGLSGLLSTSASATVYASNSGSTTTETRIFVSPDGSGNFTLPTGVSSLSANFNLSISGSNASALSGSSVYLTGVLKNSSNQTITQTMALASGYSKNENAFLSYPGVSVSATSLPTSATQITGSVNSFSASSNASLTKVTASSIPAGSYNFEGKLYKDGNIYSPSGTDSSFISISYVLLGSSITTPAASATALTQNIATCINRSLVSSSDTLTAHLVTDNSTTNIRYRFFPIQNNATSLSQTSTLSLGSVDLSLPLALGVEHSLSTTANTVTVSDLSVTKGDGTEVTQSCAPTLSAPTAPTGSFTTSTSLTGSFSVSASSSSHECILFQASDLNAIVARTSGTGMATSRTCIFSNLTSGLDFVIKVRETQRITYTDPGSGFFLYRTTYSVFSNASATISGSGSSQAPSTPSLTAEQIAAAAVAAAKAAAEAAAAIRAAEIATAQTKLATALKGDKPGSIDDFKAANINVTTAASLARINAEVLKLSAAERSDFAKIKAIADKIEFDESFFNATARPTVATYNAYGVTVTPRTVATINAKVLELPVAKRADVTAIAEIAKVETFVDRVANTDTRSSVSAATLISKGLLPADTVYKYTVVNGLSSYPEGSLNTMAKIEAAIKAELDKAGARKAKTEAIKAKIAARRK